MARASWNDYMSFIASEYIGSAYDLYLSSKPWFYDTFRAFGKMSGNSETYLKTRTPETLVIENVGYFPSGLQALIKQFAKNAKDSTAQKNMNKIVSVPRSFWNYAKEIGGDEIGTLAALAEIDIPLIGSSHSQAFKKYLSLKNAGTMRTEDKTKLVADTKGLVQDMTPEERARLADLIPRDLQSFFKGGVPELFERTKKLLIIGGVIVAIAVLVPYVLPGLIKTAKRSYRAARS